MEKTVISVLLLATGIFIGLLGVKSKSQTLIWLSGYIIGICVCRFFYLK